MATIKMMIEKNPRTTLGFLFPRRLLILPQFHSYRVVFHGRGVAIKSILMKAKLVRARMELLRIQILQSNDMCMRHQARMRSFGQEELKLIVVRRYGESC
ncbi:MAG: hypothetical protein CM15mP49_33120 [Actinomycetota bacterium]|nr:MAG: hypothetical protein CM15mP49_33120 [Actinomycetota bacterium]